MLLSLVSWEGNLPEGSEGLGSQPDLAKSQVSWEDSAKRPGPPKPRFLSSSHQSCVTARMTESPSSHPGPSMCWEYLQTTQMKHLPSWPHGG